MSTNSSFLLVSYTPLLIFGQNLISWEERWQGCLFQPQKYLLQRNHIYFDKKGLKKNSPGVTWK